MDHTDWEPAGPPSFPADSWGRDTRLDECWGHKALKECWSLDPKERIESATVFLDGGGVPGTKMYVPPKQIGVFRISDTQTIELFDKHYDVKGV